MIDINGNAFTFVTPSTGVPGYGYYRTGPINQDRKLFKVKNRGRHNRKLRVRGPEWVSSEFSMFNSTWTVDVSSLSFPLVTEVGLTTTATHVSL